MFAPLSIVRIEVEQLFGRYSYVLPPSELNLNTIYSPFILYGDNGSGKTTLLKLLFHVLSPKKKREHRSFIAKTPFASFSVFLADGKHILVNRQAGCLFGAFKLQLFQGTELIAQATVDNQKLTQLDNFYKKLSNLQLNIFFIGDNRIIESDLFDGENSEINSLEDDPKIIFQRLLRNEIPNTDRDSSLKRTLQRFEEWVRQQVINGTHLGATNVNSIYEDIAAQIISADKEDSLDSTEELIAKLKKLETRSQAFYHFGLIEALDIQKLINTLQNSRTTQSLTWKVLKPYVDSVAARLDALQNLKELFSLFIAQLNQFFRDKKVQLQVQDGLKITTTDTQELSPEMLSSGEKQLLLLFCNTLTARDQATIFIIDEPEISLNIKWQRQLIRTLLNLTKNSQVQFLLATHSIELLSQYRGNVIKLRTE
jgi:energy-coupling factor transporter ATP-binding protein EcfA2